MSYPLELSQWMAEVSTHLPHLSRCQAYLLALYSYAVVLTQSCGISHNAYFLARLLHQRENRVRQRLRETCYDAEDKRGTRRRAVEVSRCFVPLLRWVQQWWHSDEAVMVLALDATTLRQTFTVLSLSVLVAGCAIPLAWVVLPANQPGRWRPHWETLLAHVAEGLPPDYTVLVLADRGLYAKWLFTHIQANGWHPFLRINAQGSCCERQTGRRGSLATLAQRSQGRTWHGAVVCFQGKARLACTLLVMWDADQHAAWLVLTDLPPTLTSPTWYALRMWAEAGFKALKSAGFHWERTRMTDPARAARLWLVIALAALRAAATADALPEPAPRQLWPQALAQRPVRLTRPPYPRLNVLKRGILTQLAASVTHHLGLPGSLNAPTLPSAPLLEFLDDP